MSISMTDAQLKKALSLSIICGKKKWQHSTELKIADVIANSTNKDRTIEVLTKIVNETEDEQDAIRKIMAQ